MDPFFEQRRKVTKLQGEEYPTFNIKQEGGLDWAYLAQELLSKIRDCTKDRGKDRRDGKTRKKT